MGADGFVCPVDGIYVVTVEANITKTVVGRIRLEILKDGVVAQPGQILVPDQTGNTNYITTAVAVPAAAGSKLSAQVLSYGSDGTLTAAFLAVVGPISGQGPTGPTGPTGATGGVNTLNGLTGAVSIAGGTYLSTSAAGSTVTVATNATNANTASTLVARDASGNFSAGTITAALSGNATTATTATNLNGSISGDSSMGAGVILYGGSSTATSTTTTQRAIFGGDAGYAWLCRNSTSSNFILQKGASNTGNVQSMYYNSTIVGNISISTTATTYGTSSDYRLKNDVAPLTGSLALIKNLKPSTWQWVTDPDAPRGNGFIAHELAEWIPAAVQGEKDEVDEAGNPVYQSVDSSFVVPFLTAALQEAIAKIESLEDRISALEAMQ